MYHGGLIRGNTYVGGKISYYDNVDKDRISLVEVDSMVRGIDPAYAGRRMDYWYYIGNNPDALSKLSSDLDAMTMSMCACVHEIRLVVIYIDHLDLHDDYQFDLDDVEIMEQSSAWGYTQVGSSVVIEELPDSPRIMKKSSVKIVKGVPMFKASANRKQAKEVGVKIREVEEEVPTQASKAPVIDPKDKGKQKLVVEDVSKEYDVEVFEDLIDIDVTHYDESEDESSEYDDSSNADYQPAYGDEDYAHYGEDKDWTAEDEVLSDAHLEKRDKNVSAIVGTSGVNVAENVMVEDNEAMFGAIDSDEEVIGYEANSDDEAKRMKFLEFNSKTDMKDPQFCVGMIFANARILRAAIRERAIQKGWEAAFYKSDRKRVNAICKADGCPFELTASKMQHEDSLMIRKYQPQHMCARVNENSMIRAKGTKKPPLTKDEKRAKLKKRAEKLKEKRDQGKVVAKTVAKATTKSSTASTTTKVASAKNKGVASTKSSTPTRSSKRIRGGDKQVGK
ncbi:hypothetical protein ACLB2K_009687 [Fragaria x ananassa]